MFQIEVSTEIVPEDYEPYKVNVNIRYSNVGFEKRIRNVLEHEIFFVEIGFLNLILKKVCFVRFLTETEIKIRNLKSFNFVKFNSTKNQFEFAWESEMLSFAKVVEREFLNWLQKQQMVYEALKSKEEFYQRKESY